MNVLEPELVDRQQPDYDSERPQVRLQHVKVLGVVGTLLALLTMGAAFGIGLVFLSGATLGAAIFTYLIWPHLFTPDFTMWLFGTPAVSFWKLFAIYFAAVTIVKMFRKAIRG